MIHSFGVIPLKQMDDAWHAFVIYRTKQFWEFPKGHAEKGESPLEAAKRELQEETGLQVDQLLLEEPLQETYTYTENGRELHKMVHYFLATVSGEVSIQREEAQDGKWVLLSDLEPLLTYDTSKSLARKLILLIELLT